jgi:hypothetical protein
MEFFILVALFFGGMAIFVYLFSFTIALSLNLKTIGYVVLIVLNMLAGYIYTIMKDISDLAIIAIGINGAFSILGILTKVFLKLKFKGITLD